VFREAAKERGGGVRKAEGGGRRTSYVNIICDE
jgi:hypothetical protein